VTLPLALRILAWLLLAGLVIVTIGPIQWRPISPLPTQLERAVALMLVGFVFALAYPRRIVLVAAAGDHGQRRREDRAVVARHQPPPQRDDRADHQHRRDHPSRPAVPT